jgi:ethanolamine utilization protein EutN
MQLAHIVGTAVATVKHPSMKGWRLLIAQPLLPSRQPEGEPQLVIDNLGAAVGAEVIISNDGLGARQIMGQEKSPVRWFVLGLCDTP